MRETFEPDVPLALRLGFNIDCALFRDNGQAMICRRQRRRLSPKHGRVFALHYCESDAVTTQPDLENLHDVGEENALFASFPTRGFPSQLSFRRIESDQPLMWSSRSAVLDEQILQPKRVMAA